MANPRRRAVLWISLAMPLLAAGCAKTGDPQPPRAMVPRPAADLAVRQYGDQVLLTLSAPVDNIDGSPATTLAEVEIFRVTEDRFEPTAPYGEEQFLERAERILLIPENELAAHTEETGLVFRDTRTLRDRSLIYRKRFRYAARFVNRKNQTAGLSNQVQLEPVPIPGPVTGLSFQLDQDFIRIRWEAPPPPAGAPGPARLAGYSIYRSENSSSLPGQLLNTSPVADREFFDREFQFDRTYYYSVAVVASIAEPRAESVPSPALAVPAVDTFAPGPPENLQAVAQGNAVFLLWTAPEAPDLAGYRIYRSDSGAALEDLLNATLRTLPSFKDESVMPGAEYLYGVSAVDTRGNESAPVPVRIVVP